MAEVLEQTAIAKCKEVVSFPIAIHSEEVSHIIDYVLTVSAVIKTYFFRIIRIGKIEWINLLGISY